MSIFDTEETEELDAIKEAVRKLYEAYILDKDVEKALGELFDVVLGRIV